ncbi:MAG: T9SS type A sorting domain-containing protein [Flavobacteriales bacterium]|nr:T9SS type A sorting domain-containing protein [Flavobacteriales bacterium]
MRNLNGTLRWIAAVLCGVVTPAMAQTLAWTYPLSSDGSVWVWANAATSDSGVVVTGEYAGAMDADPGAGQWLLPDAPGPAQRAFLSRFDAAGDLQWAIWLGDPGSTGTTRGVFVDVAPGDTIYLYVECYGTTLDADPGPGTALVTIDSDMGDPIDPAVVVKLDPEGNFIWARHLQGRIDPLPILQAVPDGGVLLAGVFNDTLDLDPGPDTLLAVNGVGDGMYLVRLDAQGGLVWAGHLPGQCIVNGDDYDLAYDATDGTILLATTVQSGGLDLDPGPGTTLASAPAGKYRGALARYDDQGQLIWAGATGGTGSNVFRAVEVDAAGNARVGGSLFGNADLDIGPGVAAFNSDGPAQDALLVNYDPAGQLLNATLLGDASLEFVWDIALDDLGNVWVAGVYGDTTDLDPGPGVFSPPHEGWVDGGDVFYTHHTINGDLLWGGALPGPGALTYPYVATTLDGVYGSGSFGDTCDIDPTAVLQSIVDNGYQQGYVFRLHKDVTTSLLDAPPAVHALHVMPNPLPGGTSLTITGDWEGQAWVRVYDAHGAVRRQEQLRSSDGRCVLDLRDMAAGAYVVTLRSETGRVLSAPLVKE